MPDPTGTHWRKSSHSASNGGACVELAELGDTIAVRDSKHPHRPHLTLTRRTFGSLADAFKNHHPA